MLAKKIISNEISPLFTSDTGETALSWMEIHKVSHLPIVNNNQFLGLISEDDIYNLNEPDTPLGNHKLSLFSPFVYETDNIYTVVKLATELNLTTIPVLDKNDIYLGVITLKNLIKNIAHLIGSDQQGGILIIEMNTHDYSLTQLSQIVESEGVKIINLHLTPIPDSTKIEVTIKINASDLSAVIQSLTRHDYTIKESFSETSKMDSIYKDRYDEFMRFLDL
jgi:predicted transcriptional regulator